MNLKQPNHAPKRRPDEGEGPYERLLIKDVTLIDGTGSPPTGPIDILIEGNEIKDVLDFRNKRVIDNAKTIEAKGMYAMPGFVDVHAHIGGSNKGVPTEYVHKLWMGHGITTVRDPGSMIGLDWTVHEKELSKNNEIVAPHIYAYSLIGQWEKGLVYTEEDAREFVQWAKNKGADGFKILEKLDPDVIETVIKEANKNGLGSTAHLSQVTVAQANVLDAARWGLGSIEHWYGLPEALFEDKQIQNFPATYNYGNEYDRFSEAGRLWKQAAEPGSEKWNSVMEQLLELDFTFSPTFAIYEATRDAMRARTKEWHEEYTYPDLWQFFQPNPKNHGSFFFDWTTKDEIDWKENYRKWMQFINEYKNRGGRVVTGSDAGNIYSIYGFCYIRELELLQEAGFHPIEVIRAATKDGAELLSKEVNEKADFGTIRPGMRADIVLTKENPLHNFKTLYGNGVLRLNHETNEMEQVGGIDYTIKDGIVYDAKQLLADVRKMVKKAKEM